ncbi:MAG TPA: hypothetical protein VGH83_11430 [Candidatus Acidoferrum sp.]
MIANRRLFHNFSLDRALEHCRELHKPLVVFEALRCGHPWASDRLHRFVIDGMADNASVCAGRRVLYYPYVEPAARAGQGLLEALAADACVVITDEFPCFFLPRMVSAAARKLAVRLEAVDSNGLLPLRSADHAFTRAFDFRRHLQKNLPTHLVDFPTADPLSSAGLPQSPLLPGAITERWPAASTALLESMNGSLGSLPINHHVKPTKTAGGHTAACARLQTFLKKGIRLYSEEHSDPELHSTSNLSPYLHFGHISSHEIFAAITRLEKWQPKKLALRANGAREGWWNMSASAENYLEQLVTWREVGYNFCAHRQDYDRYDSLPPWALKTLAKHLSDVRPSRYTLEEFEAASTHDPLWNAA